MITDNSIEDFYNLYSLKKLTDFDYYPPVFLAHSFHDTDVPFAESQILSSLLPKSHLFVASAKTHEFDKDTTSEETLSLIDESLCFMNEINS